MVNVLIKTICVMVVMIVMMEVMKTGLTAQEEVCCFFVPFNCRVFCAMLLAGAS
jgi:hypothetical protein